MRIVGKDPFTAAVGKYMKRSTTMKIEMKALASTILILGVFYCFQMTSVLSLSGSEAAEVFGGMDAGCPCSGLFAYQCSIFNGYCDVGQLQRCILMEEHDTTTCVDTLIRPCAGRDCPTVVKAYKNQECPI